MLIQVFKDGAGIRLFRESIRTSLELPASVIHHFDTRRAPVGDVAHGGALLWSHAVHLARADRRRLRDRLRARRDQLRRRRPRLVRVRAVRALPEPGLRGPPRRHERPVAAVRPGLHDLVQPDPPDRGRRDAGGSRLDAVGHARLDPAGLPRGLPQGQRGRAAAHGKRPARARGAGGDRRARRPRGAGIYYHFSGSVTGAVRLGGGDDGDGLLLLGGRGLPRGPGGKLEPAGLGPGVVDAHPLGAADGGLRRDRPSGCRGRARRGGRRVLRGVRLGKPDPGPEGGAHPRRDAVEDAGGGDRGHGGDFVRAGVPDRDPAPEQHPGRRDRHRGPRSCPPRRRA